MIPFRVLTTNPVITYLLSPPALQARSSHAPDLWSPQTRSPSKPYLPRVSIVVPVFG